MNMSSAALSYHEPNIESILILCSFLLLLNIVNYILDRLVYCGLVGHIIIGIAWGTPGANWLLPALQHAVMQLGYLGLILVVYEGGLSTNLKALRANLFLSSLVALLGICTPISLSFLLIRLLDITLLQSFAAGAALCSTSLGTTFTVLSTSGLSNSRLGVVLSSAAMMDDVVGLIMVKVISNLGHGASSIPAVTVVRPILVSIAFAVLLLLICQLVAKPLTVHYSRWAHSNHYRTIPRTLLDERQAAFLVHTAVLLAMVTAACYAGTSNLFAAYLAGLVTTWWSDLPSLDACSKTTSRRKESEGGEGQDTQPQAEADTSLAAFEEADPGHHDTNATPDEQNDEISAETMSGLTTKPEEPENRGIPQQQEDEEANAIGGQESSGVTIYDHFYAPALNAILKPFFFASIGFSIPITRMFEGAVVWRGVVYAILMMLGKLVCGLCLIRFEVFSIHGPHLKTIIPKAFRTWMSSTKPARPSATFPERSSDGGHGAAAASQHGRDSTLENRRSLRPLSLYPATMLGCAMVARGEIGFLISSVAEANGVYRADNEDQGESSKLFLVVTWAILICTILGPLTVGLLVRRLKRLQEAERSEGTGREDPLGIWGVIRRGI